MPHESDGNEYDDLCNFIQSALFAMGSCEGVEIYNPSTNIPTCIGVTTEEALGGPCVIIFGNERLASANMMDITDQYTLRMAVGWIWAEMYALGDGSMMRCEIIYDDNGNLCLYGDGRDGWLTFQNTVDQVLQADYNTFGGNK